MTAKKKPDRVEVPAQMALARQIVNDLFGGDDAVRLVQELTDGRSGGGWARWAMIHRVYKHLIGELST